MRLIGIGATVGGGWSGLATALSVTLILASGGCHGGNNCSPDADGSRCVPANPCHVGAMTCDDGTSGCTDTKALLPNGASCGAGLVCSGGTCLACEMGATCLPAQSCRQGILDCSNGTPTCVQQPGLQPNGSTCGNSLVCSDGRCVPCAAGTSCAKDPCSNAAISCDTGQPVCLDGYISPDGTYCGPGSYCLAGNCMCDAPDAGSCDAIPL
jgi:hypothetical protein